MSYYSVFSTTECRVEDGIIKHVSKNITEMNYLKTTIIFISYHSLLQNIILYCWLCNCIYLCRSWFSNYLYKYNIYITTRVGSTYSPPVTCKNIKLCPQTHGNISDSSLHIHSTRIACARTYSHTHLYDLKHFYVKS